MNLTFSNARGTAPYESELSAFIAVAGPYTHYFDSARGSSRRAETTRPTFCSVRRPSAAGRRRGNPGCA